MTNAHEAGHGRALASSSGAREGVHPAVNAFHAARAADIQLRAADAVTAFAGSMPFVYIHATVFAGWMLVAERSPWPTLTLIVSLEAIFLSTSSRSGRTGESRIRRTTRPSSL